MGAKWTTLIVAQVAVAVAVLPASAFIASRVMRMETTGPGFAAESFAMETAELNADPTARMPVRCGHGRLSSGRGCERNPGSWA